MNTHKMKLFVGTLAIALILPVTSQAYFTTTQTATRITEDTALYTITYRFGLTNRGLYMPIIASRGIMFEDKLPYAGFTIVNKDDSQITEGVANGIILTSNKNVEIKNNQYYLPAGEVAEFTLMVLATIPPETLDEKQELSMLMSHLPFTMVTKENESVKAQLNPSELQYYRTPDIKF